MLFVSLKRTESTGQLWLARGTNGRIVAPARYIRRSTGVKVIKVKVPRHRTDRDKETSATERHLRSAEELFLGTCDSRGVDGVGVLVFTILILNIDSFEQLTTRIGRMRLRKCGSMPAVTIFVADAPTSSYDKEEIEAFYMDLEKFYKEDHTF
ncbi:hypothetical protein ANCDUO_06993 [Ancylostoma duodenale]|uniref:Uncharacterized protein n=1 Tax=Ancylostoma duodenale TaxID=51022 RepID=A0A0C2H038_9BILA|nr:hypothetical protein ANCDUO_06993 [Ancylostoma duodenale]